MDYKNKDVIVPNLNSQTILWNFKKIKALNIEKNESALIDFSYCTKFDPFAMLLFANNFLEAIEKYGVDRMKYLTKFPTSNHQYGGNMQFFHYMGVNFGKKVNSKFIGENHIPISKITRKSMDLRVRDRATDFYVELDRISLDYAKILTRDKEEANKGVSYIIREMLRNIFEHSGSDAAVICGQYWETKDLVEIAIADTGVGIKESMKSNNLIKEYMIDDKSAIAHSIIPGISKISKDLAKYKRYNKYDNSGFGLYMASNLCLKFGGDFKIVTGNQCMTMSYDKNTGKINQEYIDIRHKGTLISLRLKPSYFDNYNEIFDELIFAGEEIAKKSDKNIQEASGRSKSKIL